MSPFVLGWIISAVAIAIFAGYTIHRVFFEKQAVAPVAAKPVTTVTSTPSKPAPPQ